MRKVIELLSGGSINFVLEASTLIAGRVVRNPNMGGLLFVYALLICQTRAHQCCHTEYTAVHPKGRMDAH